MSVVNVYKKATRGIIVYGSDIRHAPDLAAFLHFPPGTVGFPVYPDAHL